MFQCKQVSVGHLGGPGEASLIGEATTLSPRTLPRDVSFSSISRLCLRAIQNAQGCSGVYFKAENLDIHSKKRGVRLPRDGRVGVIY